MRDLLFCYFIFNHWRMWYFPGGLLLGILGVGVPNSCPNLDPDSDQKMSFSLLFSDLVSKKLCHNYLDQNANKKNSLSPLHIRAFLFFSYSFGTEAINAFIHPVVSSKTILRFQTKMGEVYTCFQTKKRAQKLHRIPFGLAHTYMAYIREYPPGHFLMNINKAEHVLRC